MGAYGLVKTAPTVEPLTVAEIKANMGVVHATDDNLIGLMITAAREHAENVTRCSIAPQTRELRLDAQPGACIRLPGFPLDAISSIAYRDENGDSQTLAAENYLIEPGKRGKPPSIWPNIGESWPTVQGGPGAMVITYTAGWAAADCPSSIKMYLISRVQSLYANPETFSVGAGVIREMPRDHIESLLDQWVIPECLI